MSLDRLFEDLVLSMFAVNNYSLTKLWPFRDPLRAVGVFDLSRVAGWKVEDAMVAFSRAGFDRGGFNPYLADRLVELGLFVKEEGLGELERLLAAGDVELTEAYLLRIRGVGPAVLRNFWLLREDGAAAL